jgi:hypothetical protein
MKPSSATLLGWLILPLALLSSTEAAIVSFAGPPSTVVIGQTVPLRVEITYEAGEVNSLFSYGVALLPAPGATDVMALSIELPPPLDFNGILGPGAMRVLRSDFMAAKGTVDLSANPLAFYPGTLIATFNVRFDAAGSYPLRLDFFNTLGPTEDIFVTGGGAVLDNNITFGSTVIQVVIPEPHLAALLACGAGCLAFRRRS